MFNPSFFDAMEEFAGNLRSLKVLEIFFTRHQNGNLDLGFFIRMLKPLEETYFSNIKSLCAGIRLQEIFLQQHMPSLKILGISTEPASFPLMESCFQSGEELLGLEWPYKSINTLMHKISCYLRLMHFPSLEKVLVNRKVMLVNKRRYLISVDFHVDEGSSILFTVSFFICILSLLLFLFC